MDSRKAEQATNDLTRKSSWLPVTQSGKVLYYIHAPLFEMGQVAVSADQPKSQKTANSHSMYIRDRRLGIHVLGTNEKIDRPNMKELDRAIDTWRLIGKVTGLPSLSVFNKDRGAEIYLPYLLKGDASSSSSVLYAHTWYQHDARKIADVEAWHTKEKEQLAKRQKNYEAVAKQHNDQEALASLPQKFEQEKQALETKYQDKLSNLTVTPSFRGFKRFTTEACFLGASFVGTNPMQATRAILKHDLPFYQNEKIVLVKLSEEVHAHEAMFDKVLNNISMFVNQHAIDGIEDKELDFHMPYYDYALFIVELYLNKRITLIAMDQAINIIFDKKCEFEGRVKKICKEHRLKVNIISPFDNLFGTLNKMEAQPSESDLMPADQIDALRLMSQSPLPTTEYKSYYLPSFAMFELTPQERVHATASYILKLLGIDPNKPLREDELAPILAERLISENSSTPVINQKLLTVWQDFLRVHRANGNSIEKIHDIFNLGNAVMQGITAYGSKPYETCSMVAFSGKQIQLSYEYLTNISKLLNKHREQTRKTLVESGNVSVDKEKVTQETRLSLCEKMEAELQSLATKVENGILAPEKYAQIKKAKMEQLDKQVCEKATIQINKALDHLLEKRVEECLENNPHYTALLALEETITKAYPPIVNLSLLDPVVTYDPDLDATYCATESHSADILSNSTDEDGSMRDEDKGRTYNGLTFYSQIKDLAPFLKNSGILTQAASNAAAKSTGGATVSLDCFLEEWHRQSCLEHRPLLEQAVPPLGNLPSSERRPSLEGVAVPPQSDLPSLERRPSFEKIVPTQSPPNSVRSSSSSSGRCTPTDKSPAKQIMPDINEHHFEKSLSAGTSPTEYEGFTLVSNHNRRNRRGRRNTFERETIEQGTDQKDTQLLDVIKRNHQELRQHMVEELRLQMALEMRQQMEQVHQHLALVISQSQSKVTFFSPPSSRPGHLYHSQRAHGAKGTRGGRHPSTSNSRRAKP